MKFIEKIFQAGGQVFEVGGTVRDSLLRRPHKDKDYLVIRVPFVKLKELLQSLGKVVVAGKSFGVIKFRPKGSEEQYDIALPRVEKSTGGGHRDFAVHFDENLPIETDLNRRDFTINAMARELHGGQIVDPFHGQTDLQNKTLRQVFSECFSEDPLRLLRAIQFAARFELTVEPTTYEAMQKHASKLKSISPERIVDEIGKLLQAQQPSKGFYLMKETGILPLVFPELAKCIGVEQATNQSGDVFDHTMKVLDAARSHSDLNHRGDLEIMFASIFHDVGKPQTAAKDPETGHISFFGHQVISTRMAKKWFQRYPATMLGMNVQNVLQLIHHHLFEIKSLGTDQAIRRLIHKIGQGLIFKLLDFRIANEKGGANPDKFDDILELRKKIQEEIERKPPLSPQDLALNGFDLIKLGYPEGPMLGKILEDLMNLVLEEPTNNQREKLLEYCRKRFPRNDLSLHQG